jgi:predicted N-formylglutamate amidohydrolase
MSGGDTKHRHCSMAVITHALVEICHDQIGDEGGVESWADCLTPILATLTDRPELHEIELAGSRVI